MAEVVSLAEYRKKKEEAEINRLKEELESLIEDLEIVPEPYFIPVTSDYAFMGSPSYDTTPAYNPTASDCAIELYFVSCVLKSLGELEAARDIDKIVDKLNSKE